jgi:hypothetical protein
MAGWLPFPVCRLIATSIFVIEAQTGAHLIRSESRTRFMSLPFAVKAPVSRLMVDPKMPQTVDFLYRKLSIKYFFKASR